MDKFFLRVASTIIKTKYYFSTDNLRHEYFGKNFQIHLDLELQIEFAVRIYKVSALKMVQKGLYVSQDYSL